MRHRTRRLIGRLLLGTAAATAPACTSLRVQQGQARAPLPEGKDGQLRLSLRSGAVLYMYDAQIVGDSIVGFDRPASRTNAARLAVRTDEVDAVAVRKGDAFKTVLAVVGGTIAVLSMVLLAACLSLSNSYA
jgi:hypothetical protein